MTETAQDLRATLGRLRDMLGRGGEGHWSGIVARALAETDDAALARTVESWFGGGTGLDRLAMSPARGHAVAACATDSFNRAVASLRAEARRLAGRVLAHKAESAVTSGKPF